MEIVGFVENFVINAISASKHAEVIHDNRNRNQNPSYGKFIIKYMIGTTGKNIIISVNVATLSAAEIVSGP